MEKSTLYKVLSGIGYLFLIGLFIGLIVIFEWSWWIILFVVLIPLIIAFIVFIVWKLKNKNVEQERLKQMPKNLTVEQVQDFVRQWVVLNDEVADLCKKEIQVEPYTPKQEGLDKLTVYKVKYPRYWNRDFLFLAVSKEKAEVIMYRIYQSLDEAEKDFESRIDNIVLNPMQIAETEERERDELSGRERVIRRRTPISQLKNEEEKKQIKKDEKEEGIEHEEE